MRSKHLTARELSYLLPVSLALGAWLSSVQGRNWVSGIPAFSFLFLLALVMLRVTLGWSGGGRPLTFIVALAFFLRLAVGVSLYWALPLYGHADADDRAGYVFTDAHTRDAQAWRLAASEQPILDAFSRKYSSDQYGGLLAWNALIYRSLSADARRPLLLILFAAFFAALGVPFVWMSLTRVFGEKVAWAATWIFALYPESVLLGSAAMREPYLLTFSAWTLWGFLTSGVQARSRPGKEEVPDSRKTGLVWLGSGLLGMLLVSPAVALATIILLAGWMFFAGEGHRLSWTTLLAIAVVFLIGLFVLSSSLNRSGQFEATSPLHVINNWLQAAVKWDAYRLERESGWVQKLFDEMPEWMRLPFVAVYGLLQPVLPATLLRPTTWIWKLIMLPRTIGWYALIPALVLSFVAASGPGTAGKMEGSGKIRNLLLWISLLAWLWILLAALRGGGDLWDNPRYRTILFLWQAILAGYVWVWWRETRTPWMGRLFAMELVFTAIFSHWYGARYYHWPGQLPFPVMIALILGLWGAILAAGWWLDRRRA